VAHAGEVIEKPVTGERVVFRQTVRDTGGEMLQFDHYLKVNGIGPYEHFHPRQHERFRVVSDTRGVRLDGREHVLRAGEEITVPPEARHTWWNASDEEMHQITEFRPALKFEVFTSTSCALGREEHTRVSRRQRNSRSSPSSARTTFTSPGIRCRCRRRSTGCSCRRPGYSGTTPVTGGTARSTHEERTRNDSAGGSQVAVSRSEPGGVR
jgi:quercetin dioxygenase-like cupin family protein